MACFGVFFKATPCWLALKDTKRETKREARRETRRDAKRKNTQRCLVGFKVKPEEQPAHTRLKEAMAKLESIALDVHSPTASLPEAIS